MKRIFYSLGIALLTLALPGLTDAQSLLGNRDAVTTEWASSNTQPVARVKRVGTTTGAPFNTNWTGIPTISPAITTWTQANMGQVFGVTTDLTGNVFFAATAGYYFNPSSFPNMLRLVLPVSGVVPAGAGLNSFHAVTPGGPIGLIYKADALNLNTVTAIVTGENVAAPTATAGVVGKTALPNMGYGIGNVACAKNLNRLYATNLEDGKIYSFIPTTGVIDDVFDPFAPDGGASGIAPYGERLFAVAVNEEFGGATRLYYSVLKSVTAAGSLSEVWSVRLNASGKFVPTDNSLELTVPVNTFVDPTYFGTFISDIAFSVRGEMLVAEKGEPHHSHVYMYYGHHNAWSAPGDLFVSPYSNHTNSAGGADFGHDINSQGRQVCDSLVWMMENAWTDPSFNYWYGMQSMPYTGYTGPQSTWPGQAHIVDLDGAAGTAPKNKFGDIVFFDTACTGQGPTDICSKISVTAVKDTGSCCYNIYVRNNYHGQYFTGLNISTSSLNIDNVTAGPVWGGITYQGPRTVKFGDTAKNWYMPKDSTFLLARICLSGSGIDAFNYSLIGNGPQYDTVCSGSINIQGCSVPVQASCLQVLSQDAICDSGVVKMRFQIKNNSYFTMRALSFYNTNPNVKLASYFYPIADLAPGATSPMYTVPLVVSNNDTSGCFIISACDLNAFPGTSGAYPKYCCMDSIQYCVKIPTCNPCDAIQVSAVKTDSVNCCYSLNLTNNALSTKVSCIRMNGLGGLQFAILRSWGVKTITSASDVTFCAPGGAAIGNGTYNDFVAFCLTGTASASNSMGLTFLDSAGNVLCVKRISLGNCTPVLPTCANIVQDSLYCDGKTTKLTFSVKNNSPFAIYQVDLRTNDTGFKLSQDIILPSPAIPVGGTGGPYTISIDSSSASSAVFCVYLTGHNAVYTPGAGATVCCTDSMAVMCRPMMKCGDDNCCHFSGLIIPNGITPNSDGVNDSWVIQNSNICKNISIRIYNRWGNVVYKDDSYSNDWAGTNQNGGLLPQGTYFAVIRLEDGEEQAMYLDLRY